MAKQMAFAPMDGKALSALIGSIGKAAESLNGKVQQAATQCVAHAFEHGDVRPATQLFEAMTKGMRRQSIVSWFELNGPFAFDTKKNAFGLHNKEAWLERLAKEGTALNDYCTKLLSVSWLEAKAEKIESEVDVLESIEKLLASISKKVATAQKDGATKPVKHDKLRDYLADAVLKYKSDIDAQVEEEPELQLPKAA